MLNGLHVSEISSLTCDDVDLELRWIRFHRDCIPLASQSAEALKALTPNDNGAYFAPQILEDALGRLPLSEDDAHARVAGALWFTSEDGRLIRETGGFTYDAPTTASPN